MMMNRRGHKETLVAHQKGNSNAVKYGVHSPRLISERAAEITNGLLESFDFTAAEMVAVNEAARWGALLEAIDRDLDERGLVDRHGKERYLLALRVRASARLERWLTKLEGTMKRKLGERAMDKLERADYLRELQHIAVGNDPTATARDRLGALKELLRLETDQHGEQVTKLTIVMRGKDEAYEPGENERVVEVEAPEDEFGSSIS
jgi:hypothetical protein